jgi:hypothetical protein
MNVLKPETCGHKNRHKRTYRKEVDEEAIMFFFHGILNLDLDFVFLAKAFEPRR